MFSFVCVVLCCFTLRSQADRLFCVLRQELHAYARLCVFRLVTYMSSKVISHWQIVFLQIVYTIMHSTSTCWITLSTKHYLFPTNSGSAPTTPPWNLPCWTRWRVVKAGQACLAYIHADSWSAFGMRMLMHAGSCMHADRLSGFGFQTELWHCSFAECLLKFLPGHVRSWELFGNVTWVDCLLQGKLLATNLTLTITVLSCCILNWHTTPSRCWCVHSSSLAFELLKGCQTICIIYTS